MCGWFAPFLAFRTLLGGSTHETMAERAGPGLDAADRLPRLASCHDLNILNYDKIFNLIVGETSKMQYYVE